jgi:tetratricopeptide (TPR) repeat protein
VTDPRLVVAEALADRYVIEGDLGQGGMATVFKARDLRHGNLVAIKVLRPELVLALGGERFTREVRITAALQHPHILPLLDSGEAGTLPYYVMPFVDGASLAERLAREGPLPVAAAVQYVAEVADGLAYAHDKGLIHRDLKPANILLSQGHALLADFGVARVLDSGNTDALTDSGLALGTAAYMSPEQAAGERVDRRADVYALGCVLFELLTGSPPFTGASQRQIMARHAVDPVPSIRTVRPEVPMALEAAIHRALAKTPGDRFPDASAFRAAILEGGAQPSGAYAATPGASRTRGRLLAGVAVAAIAIVGTLLWSRGRAASPLDPDRVMVYPLVVPADWPGSRSVGEDVSTMIGSAMDGAGRLRWLDGWQLLPPALRDDPRQLSDSTARAIARQHRARYVVTGRVATRGTDSAEVLLTLHDLMADSLVARPRGASLAREAWRAGLRAVTQMLPALIPAGTAKPEAEWEDRDPQAVAAFLAGEAAFRRVQLDEAVAQYQAAVEKDSTFGLAALHGAQMAQWQHRDAQGLVLAERAQRFARSPRERALAAGLGAFLRGDADSAVRALDAAVALDPRVAAAWMQLGETWMHLVPLLGNADSAAAYALGRALALDSGATHFLYHHVELVARSGDRARLAPLAARFMATARDTGLRENVQAIERCVSGTLDPRREATERPRALLAAIKLLALSQPGCTVPAARALLAVDTAATSDADGRRFYALVTLTEVLLGQGKADSAAAAIEAHLARWKQGSSLYLLYAPVYPALAPQARAVLRADSAKHGLGLVQHPNSVRIWMDGAWAALDGQRAAAGAAAAELARRAATSRQSIDSVRAGSLEALLALADGDTATALAKLEAHLRRPVEDELVAWDESGARGLERLLLGRLLVARGQPQRARGILEALDNPAPSSFPLYQPSARRLAADAAAAMGDARAAATLRQRAIIADR